MYIPTCTCTCALNINCIHTMYVTIYGYTSFKERGIKAMD